MNKIFRSRAPLRISFAGGGTDVPPYPQLYGGAIISTTIDRYAYVTLKKNSSQGIRIISHDYNLIEKFSSVSDIKIKGKTSLIRAALSQVGLNNTNIDVIIHADSPPGSGLGSSSAVAVALIGALALLKNKPLSRYQIAQQAVYLERELLGIKGGFQDQYASTFGGFNFIEFSKNITVNPLRLHNSVLNELLGSMILVDTQMNRLSSRILIRQIKKYEQKDSTTLEQLEKIKHLAFEMKNYLLKGDIWNLGTLLDSYWKFKKLIDTSISNKKIDKFYNSMIKNGALGGKILGAGGGGHMLLLCNPEDREQLLKHVKKSEFETIKFNFDNVGLQTWMLANNKVIY